MLKPEYELLEHQKEVLKFFKSNGKIMVSLPTGGGKTLISLVIYRLLKSSEYVNKLLYITIPPVCHQIKENEDEFFENPIVDLINVREMSKQKREFAYKSNPEILVVNYQKINNDIKFLCNYVDNKTLIVFDEAVNIKNTSSKVSKNSKLLCDRTSYVLPMTATPFMKNIGDIANVLNITSVLKINNDFFTKTFCKIEYQRIKPFKRGGKLIKKVPVVAGWKNVDLFFDMIKNKIFFKNKSDLKSIPPVSCSIAFVDKNKNSSKAINSIDSPNEIQIDKSENYPSLILGEKTPISPKHSFIADYILNNVDNKVFIFTKFRTSTVYLQKLFEKSYNIKSLAVYGGVDVKKAKDTFINDNNIKCIIGNSSISTGFDGLQKVADTVIFADLPYSYGEYQQIIGRIVRNGSNFNSINIIIPIVKNSVDEIRIVHIYSQISLILKSNKDMVDNGTYDKQFIKSINGLYDDEWVKKEIYKRYKISQEG